MVEFNAVFWRWFNSSVVADNHGDPLVVYHGTPEKFTAFDLSKTVFSSLGASGGLGAFFTVNPKEAAHYAYTRRGGRDYPGTVIAAYLSIKNPRIIKQYSAEADRMLSSKQSAIKLREELISLGYDGAITHLGEFVAFYPQQIKAIDNDGTWDADDPDIRSNPEGYKPIPKLVYHASPHADEITKQGMRLAKSREEQTFGGHTGQYISATTRENAEIYAEALRDVIGAARGDWGYEDLDAFVAKWRGDVKEIEGFIKTNIPYWLEGASRYAPHKLGWNLPMIWLLEHIHAMSQFPLFINLEDSWPRFMKMKPERVGVIEIEVDPRIVYSRGYLGDPVKGAYTYNPSEEEWRIHDLAMIKSVRRL